MSSFKQYYNQKKFEEEIEVDEEHPAGAVYKIPLGSTYQGPIDREGFQDSYIIVNIEDELEDGGLVETDKLGIFKYTYVTHKEKDDEGTTELSDFEPDEVNHILKELKNSVYMFKEHIEQEGKEFKGFSIEIEEDKNSKDIYEKTFSVLNGKLEETSTNKYVYRLEQ
jgi:hypothetical protein